MQEAETSHGGTDHLGYVSGLLCEGAPLHRISLAVQGHEALSQHGVGLDTRITHLTSCPYGILEVFHGTNVVTPLAHVPDELPHEGGRFSLHLEQRTPYPWVAGVLPKVANLA